MQLHTLPRKTQKIEQKLESFRQQQTIHEKSALQAKKEAEERER